MVALLWYELFFMTLKNDYDACVVNKSIDSKWCTIMWYSDDLRVSHVDQTVVDNTVKCINKHFGFNRNKWKETQILRYGYNLQR